MVKYACGWMTVLVGSLLTSLASGQGITTEPGEDAWYRFPQCPVLVERTLPVPALESGVIQQLHVELNSSIEENGLLATLDTQLAQTELDLARLQYTAAKKLADDNSDIEYHEVALQQVQLELENHQQLRRNVSDSEIRRLQLAVGKAELALTRSKHMRAQAVMEAQVKYASIGLVEEHLNRRSIHSPIQGVVSKVVCQAGQWVEAGQPIVEVKELNRLMVDRLVPATSIHLAQIVGSKALVQVPALPNSSPASPASPVEMDGQPTMLSGVVTSYDPEISARGHIRIHVRVTNRQEAGRWLLLPGMSVDLLLARDHILNAEQALQAQASEPTNR